MQRIATATRAVDLFGAGKHGFKDGNLGLGVLPTDFEALFCNQMQEEVMAIIEGAGVAPSAAVSNQIVQAIRRLAGANVTVVTAAMSPFALTADHVGLVLINAAAGNVVLNLPLANVVASLPLPYDFGRIDATVNTVTTNAAGANLIDGVASFTLVGQWASRSIRGDAVSAWATTASSVLIASSAEAQAQADNSKVITPLRLAQAFQGANQSIVSNGWQRMPGGLILQWGQCNASSVGTTNTLPITFPNAGLRIIGGNQSTSNVLSAASLTTTNFLAICVTGTSVHNYLAIGH